MARADEVAVRTPDESITFAQLLARADERAAAVAAAVGDLGLPVAVDVESNVDSVVAILAVLCSGRPVIFLDPFLPADRRAHILERSGARHLASADLAGLPAAGRPAPDPLPGDPSVIIFTSGSTGRPKGVVHAQRNWVNQAADGRAFLGFGAGDRAAVLLPLSFGAGFDALIMGLLNGVTLLLWDVRRRTTAGLRDWLDREGATTVHATPSLFRSWLPELGTGGAVDSVRLLTTCGEPVHHDDVALIRATLSPRGVFCSWSGSSELGNLAFNRFDADRALPVGAVPVGTPATDKRVRIIDDTGNELSTGFTGEIVVDSAHLASGYHRDPELTASRFESIADGRRRLRTGDLGRFDDSGQLHLIGRRDDAVKIRGYLVEPVEVEAAIRALPWTRDVVVTADRTAGRLAAYVAVDPRRWAPSPAQVRTALAKTLAPWMIPRDVVILDELPRNERGKVDRVALPPPPARDLEPVRGPTEATLLHIWTDVLGLDSIGRDEDFVALGGDSLAAARMLTEIRDRWLVDIPSADFAQAPTIAATAELLDQGHRERAATTAGATLSRLRDGEGTPLFVAAGAGSPAASLLPLVHELRCGGAVYGLQPHGLENRGRADRTIAAAARRAVRDVLTVAPQGPYRLAGYSYGGFVALEAASILASRGADVEVVLIDALFEPELRARVRGERVVARTADTDRPALPDRGDGATGGPAGTAPAVASGGQRLPELWTRAVMKTLVATAGLWRLPTTLAWTVFWDLGRQMIRRHRPTAHDGPVTLIMAETNPDDETTWSKLATGKLTLVRVGGDHHSMMRVPQVSATAAAVDAALGVRLGDRSEQR